MHASSHSSSGSSQANLIQFDVLTIVGALGAAEHELELEFDLLSRQGPITCVSTTVIYNACYD
jgi:hypothetical protein